MKAKTIFVTLLATFVCAQVSAQSVIKMTVGEPQSENENIGLCVISDKPYTVDYGDGKPMEYEPEAVPEEGEEPVFRCMPYKGKIVTITCPGTITEFHCEPHPLSKRGKLIQIQNRVTNLDVSKAVGLKKLNCFNNELSVLDVSMLPLLERLDCSENQLKDLNLTKNSNLRVVYAHRNKLKTVLLPKQPLIEFLNVAQNDLLTLNLKGMSKLKSIQAYMNAHLIQLELDTFYPELLGVDLRATALSEQMLNQLFIALKDVNEIEVDNPYDGYWMKKIKILAAAGAKNSCTKFAVEKGWQLDVEGTCRTTPPKASTVLQDSHFSILRQGNRLVVEAPDNAEYDCLVYDASGALVLVQSSLKGKQITSLGNITGAIVVVIRAKHQGNTICRFKC